MFNFIDDKSKLRSWQFWFFGSIFVAIAGYFNVLSLGDTINMIGRATLGLGVLYVGGRVLNHKRTHELNNEQQRHREIAYIIAIGFIAMGAGL